MHILHAVIFKINSLLFVLLDVCCTLLKLPDIFNNYLRNTLNDQLSLQY